MVVRPARFSRGRQSHTCGVRPGRVWSVRLIGAGVLPGKISVIPEGVGPVKRLL
jgi:hypothetical protein